MTLIQLFYVSEAAKHGSINKAAQENYTLQSTVSTAIRDLEAELGFKIFIRYNKGVKLTDAGRNFILYARELLDYHDRILNIFSKKTDLSVSRLNISCQRYAHVTEAFAEFFLASQHQDFEYRLQEKSYYEVLDDVQRSDCDIGVVFLTESTFKVFTRIMTERKIEYHELVRLHPVAFLRKQHPLAQKSKLKLEELSPYPYIVFAGDTNDLKDKMNLLGYRQPNRTILVSDRATTYDLLLSLDAYTLGSGAGFDDTDSKIVKVPLVDMNNDVIPCWIKMMNSVMTKTMEEFVRHLSNVCKKATGLKCDK